LSECLSYDWINGTVTSQAAEKIFQQKQFRKSLRAQGQQGAQICIGSADREATRNVEADVWQTILAGSGNNKFSALYTFVQRKIAHLPFI